MFESPSNRIQFMFVASLCNFLAILMPFPLAPIGLALAITILVMGRKELHEAYIHGLPYGEYTKLILSLALSGAFLLCSLLMIAIMSFGIFLIWQDRDLIREQMRQDLRRSIRESEIRELHET